MAEENADIILTKGPITAIQVSVNRSLHGLSIGVKAIPQVEEFFRGLSGGDTESTAVMGRAWFNPKDGEGLQIYPNFAPIPGPATQENDEPPTYSLDKVCGNLVEVTVDRNGKVAYKTNISFLKLVGISEGAGVTFGVRGVFSTKEVENIRSRIGRALGSFYRDYLQTVNFSVSISLQEMRF